MRPRDDDATDVAPTGPARRLLLAALVALIVAGFALQISQGICPVP